MLINIFLAELNGDDMADFPLHPSSFLALFVCKKGGLKLGEYVFSPLYNFKYLLEGCLQWK